MAKKRLVKLIAFAAFIAVVLVMHVTLSGANSPFVPDTNQDKLPILIQGCANAVSSLEHGKGKVIVHSTYIGEDGNVTETESENDVTFFGSKFKISAHKTYLENEPREGSDPKLLLAPGAVRSQQISCDGQRIILLKATEGALVGGVKMKKMDEAVISDAGVGEGFSAVADIKRDIAVVGHGVWDLAKMKNVWRFLEDYTMSGPRIVGRETLDGDECFVVEVVYTAENRDDTKTVWLWIDPQKGHTVPLMRMWMQGGILKEKTLYQERTTKIRQYSDGVWGPAEGTFDEYVPNWKKGGVYKHWHCVTTYDPDFRFDLKPSDEDMSLKLPSGTRVFDENLDASYTAP